jgi:heptosyltransferase-2
MNLARTVIIDPAFLGDVVFDAPLVQAVKARVSEAFVGIVVRPPADAVARAIRGIDRVHVFDKRGRDRGIAGVERIAAELRRENYQTALVPHPSVRSVLVAARAGIPTRVGASQGLIGRRLLTERRPSECGEAFVRARLRLLGEVDTEPPLAGALMSERSPGSGRARVGLVLGSEWPTKRWAIEQAADLLAGMDPSRLEVAFLGAEGERWLYGELLARLRGRSLPPIVDAIGEDVAALIRRIAGLDVLIAGDTGPLHIARGLGVATIALFGPTSEARHVFGPEDHLLFVPLECRPCSDHGSMTCPEGHHRCMKDLSAARVGEALERALEHAQARRSR